MAVMKNVFLASILSLYCLSPMLALYLAGSGVCEQVAKQYLMLFPLGLVALLIYACYNVTCWFRATVNRAKSHFLPRVVWSIILLFLVFTYGPLAYTASFRQGAWKCINTAGGFAFIEQLLRDCRFLAAGASDGVVYVPHDKLPSSFRSLGGQYAKVYVDSMQTNVQIHTSGVPVYYGWMITQPPSPSAPIKGGVRVADGVYRYSWSFLRKQDP